MAPTAWRGGRLVARLKKASAPMSPTSYRALILMDHLAKSFPRCIQHHWQGPIHNALSRTQFGAGKFAGTRGAIQLIREWRDAMNAHHQCWAVLFLDLNAAFDHTVRQRMLATEFGPHLRYQMVEAGVSPTQPRTFLVTSRAMAQSSPSAEFPTGAKSSYSPSTRTLGL